MQIDSTACKCNFADVNGAVALAWAGLAHWGDPVIFAFTLHGLGEPRTGRVGAAASYSYLAFEFFVKELGGKNVFLVEPWPGASSSCLSNLALPLAAGFYVKGSCC